MAGTILTTIGLSKLAAATPQNQLNITHIAVGDGNGGFPTLSPNSTALTNEVWRGDASNPIKDGSNSTYVYFETNIPPEVGPFDVREIACFDIDGDMIAIGNTSLIQKPSPSDDASFAVAVKIFISLENASDFDLIYQNVEVTSHNSLMDREKSNSHPATSISTSDSKSQQNVQEKLTEITSRPFGLFKSPVNLGHVIGDFLYIKNSPTNAEINKDLTGYYPKGYDCNIHDYELKGLKAYFVEQGATGSGVSISDPMGSIGEAASKSDVDVVFVKKGVYGVRGNFGRATPIRDVAIKSVFGRSTITTIDEDGVWSNNGDGTYTLTIPSGNINEVYDLGDSSSEDDLGYLVKLVEVDTLTECQSTAGTWYRGTALAIVHRNVAEAPTNETVYCLRSAPIGFQNFSTNIWFEGFKTFGGQNGGLSILNSTGTFTGYNNEYLYGTGANGDSFNCNGCFLVINEKCTAAAGEKDGFNYHNNENRETHAIEINCIGLGNRKFGTGNGSTAHENCRVIRIGCDYAYNNGPGVADIENVKSLNVCCTSNNNRNDQNSKGFLFTGNSEAWCDSVTALYNRTADIATQNNAILHIRDENAGIYNLESTINIDDSF